MVKVDEDPTWHFIRAKLEQKHGYSSIWRDMVNHVEKEDDILCKVKDKDNMWDPIWLKKDQNSKFKAIWKTSYVPSWNLCHIEHYGTSSLCSQSQKDGTWTFWMAISYVKMEKMTPITFSSILNIFLIFGEEIARRMDEGLTLWKWM